MMIRSVPAPCSRHPPRASLESLDLGVKRRRNLEPRSTWRFTLAESARNTRRAMQCGKRRAAASFAEDLRLFFIRLKGRIADQRLLLHVLGKISRSQNPSLPP